MNFQQLATTGFGTRLWMALGRWLPPPLGFALAAGVTGVLAQRRESSLYRIVHANQAAVLGPAADPEEVHDAVRAMLRHAGRAAYDLMHLVAQGAEAIQAAIAFPAEFWAHVAAARATGRGVMICGCHLSNFNLGFIAFALSGFPVQVLSPPAPAGGFKLIHELRRSGVIEETPIEMQALRKAVGRLRGGGIVLTGADWPLGAVEGETVPFFGRPAHLPTGHVRLAISAHAVMLPMACRWEQTRGYYVMAAPHLELELTGDRSADVLHNARRVLAVFEGWITETPEQWLMYHPVW